MDWLQKNYERVGLIAGVAVLLVSAFCIFQRAIGFQSQFTELQSHPTQRPASPPGKAKEAEDALQKLGSHRNGPSAGVPGSLFRKNISSAPTDSPQPCRPPKCIRLYRTNGSSNSACRLPTPQ